MPDTERQEAVESAEAQVGAPVEHGDPAVARALLSTPLGDPARLTEMLAGGGDAWRAGVINGLQRASGNRAVTRMLQRQTTAHARTRTRVEEYATAAYEQGPVWSVRLTVRGAPQDDPEGYREFLDACMDGIRDAAYSLGSGAEARRRTLRVSMRYRAGDHVSIQTEAFEKARQSVLPPRTTVDFSEDEVEPIVVERPAAPEPPEQEPEEETPPTESAAAVIERHTRGLNLREEALAAELRRRMPADSELVISVLRTLPSTDRDDVAVALLEEASDEQIVAWGADPGGRRVLVTVLGELSSGATASDEREQQRRVMTLVPGEAIRAEEAPEEPAPAERPEDVIAAHQSWGNLRERELARDLLRRLRAGQSQLAGLVMDTLESEDRDDVATHLLEVADDDAQVQSIARDAGARAFLLRLVREMHGGVTTNDERRQMQRVMRLVTSADREAALEDEGAPVVEVEVEVLTFLSGSPALDLVGTAVAGARGHTAITVGGLTYSFELGWSCGLTRDEYLRANLHRDAVGQVLRIPEADAQLIQDRLNDSCGKGFYGITGDICTDTSARVLESVLTTLGPGGWDPGAFVARLDATGEVARHRFYPRTLASPPQPVGGQGDAGVSRNLLARTPLSREPAAPAAAPETAAPAKETGIAESASTGRYTAAAKKLGADWDSLGTAEERAKKLAEAALAELRAAGVPEYTTIVADLGVSAGQFSFPTWTMKLGKTRFEASKPSGEHLAKAAADVFHESRHAEQWFRMARLEAGRGKKADAIAKTMGLPRKIADEAAKSPLAADTPEGKEAETWYESVYGAKAAERNKILKDLPVLKQALLDANAEHDRVSKDAGASKDAKDAAQRKQAEAKRKFDEVYAKYLAMPEEADAWKVDAAVESAVKGP